MLRQTMFNRPSEAYVRSTETGREVHTPQGAPGLRSTMVVLPDPSRRIATTDTDDPFLVQMSGLTPLPMVATH